MGSENSRMEGASMQIVFEGRERAYSADQPIVGVIEVDTDKAIPAYGIEMFLNQIDLSHRIDRGDKG